MLCARFLTMASTKNKIARTSKMTTIKRKSVYTKANEDLMNGPCRELGFTQV